VSLQIRLLGCDTVQFCKWAPTCANNVLQLSCRPKTLLPCARNFADIHLQDCTQCRRPPTIHDSYKRRKCWTRI